MDTRHVSLEFHKSHVLPEYFAELQSMYQWFGAQQGNLQQVPRLALILPTYLFALSFILAVFPHPWGQVRQQVFSFMAMNVKVKSLDLAVHGLLGQHSIPNTRMVWERGVGTAIGHQQQQALSSVSSQRDAAHVVVDAASATPNSKRQGEGWLEGTYTQYEVLDNNLFGTSVHFGMYGCGFIEDLVLT